MGCFDQNEKKNTIYVMDVFVYNCLKVNRNFSRTEKFIQSNIFQ